METRSLILDLASSLLQTRGFHGFSYRDISKPLGIKNAAVHYHFPSKGDLAQALIDGYLEILQQGTRDFMQNGGSSLEQLENLFSFTLRECKAERCICPMGAFAIDIEGVPESVRISMKRFHDKTLAWLVKVMQVGREQQELHYRGSPEGRALALLASIQGARQLTRVAGIDAVKALIEHEREALING